MLGCGSAFNHELGNTAGVLTVTHLDGKQTNILLDCGYDVPGKIDVSKLDAVILTHTHADHAGGLEELAFRLKYQYPGKRVKLISRAAVIDYAEHMLFPVLRASMYSDNDIDEANLKTPLSHYFDVVRIKYEDEPYHLTEICDGLSIAMPRVPHIHTLPCASISMEFIFERGEERNVWWSGDTCKVHRYLYDDPYDLVFHEVQFGYNTTGKNAHTLYEDLAHLCRVGEDSIGRLVLTHLPDELPEEIRLENQMSVAQPLEEYIIL